MVQTVNGPQMVILLLLRLKGGDGILLEHLHLHENFVLLAALLKVDQLFAIVRLMKCERVVSATFSKPGSFAKVVYLP